MLLWDHRGGSGRQGRTPVVCITALHGDGPDANPRASDEGLC